MSIIVAKLSVNPQKCKKTRMFTEVYILADILFHRADENAFAFFMWCF